ncbi:MAG: MASE3 domain-containing protein [Desulfonatronovibrionaceae bacterium]
MTFTHRRETLSALLLGLLILTGLAFLSALDFLLFHTVSELFSITIAFCVFILAWNSRDNVEYSAYPLLGVAYLCVGILDGMHTLSYKGMPFFQADSPNLPTQLWIATRYLEALSLLIFSWFMGRNFSLKLPASGYILATALILIMTLSGNFPDCFVEGQGLTAFKVGSEYLIILILLVTMVVLFKRRQFFDHHVFSLMIVSLGTTALAELAFTFYVSVYGLSNLVGHFLKIVSFYLIYKAIVATGINRPQTLLFRKLQESEERYDSLTGNLYGISFRMHLDGTPVYIRGAVQAITGYEEQDFLDNKISWEQIVLPEDLHDILSSSAQKDLLKFTGYSTSREYRILRRQGEVRWVYESIHNVSDEDGRPAYLEGVILDINRQKQAEETVASQAKLLRSLLEAIQESALLLDTQGRILHANSTVARRLGTEAEDLPGRRLADLMPEQTVGDVESMLQVMQVSRHPLQYETRRGDRSELHYLFPVLGEDGRELTGIAMLALDITERKQRELELNKLRLAVANSPVPILITDTRGIIEYVNQAFTQVTGYTHDEAVGQTPKILKSGEHSREFYQELWKTISSGSIWRGEFHNRRKDGRLYWEQSAIAPVRDESGQVINYVGIKEDITDKKDLERIRSDVERIMRHDLKTPLNGIIGLAQVMLHEEESLTPEQKELLDYIEQSGWKMLNMINLSLDMFKMETGSYEYQPGDVNLLGVIRQLIAENSSQLKSKSINPVVLLQGAFVEHEKSLMISAEERLLYTMLANLFANALEASPGGNDVTLDITLEDQVCLRIINKGAVPEAVRGNFFDKYNSYGKEQGTGLGTYSAWLAARTMGFSIQLEVEDENDLTRIIIYMPMAAE